MKEKIVIGMSGGVDSSVAAHLLKEQGYEVLGVTMQTGSVPENVLQDAAEVAAMLGIPHYVIDFSREFRHYVMDYFAQSYSQGRTPNPCIACNRYVKWESLLNYAEKLGAELVATGHYTRIMQLENGRYTLQRTTGGKDQTYVLYGLSQDQLRRTRMPLYNYTKDQIREIARGIGLNVADKPDSQEICFIPDQDYAGWLARHTGATMPEGNFVNLEGKVLGRHKGLWHYTIGQRKGLGIALGQPAFVVELRPQTNEVVLGTNEDVFAREMLVEDINYVAVAEGEGPVRLDAQIRYAHRPAPGTLNGNIFTFDEPQRAITPGQGAVFYRDNYIYAGGVVRNVLGK